MIKPSLIVVAGMVLASPIHAAPVKVEVEPAYLANFSAGQKNFGKLHFLGGLKLTATAKGFGGFSGLAVSRDGNRLVAISDRAQWLQARLETKNGRLVGAGGFDLSRLKLEQPGLGNNWRDAEALAPFDGRGIDGLLLVGFERRSRLLRYRFGRYKAGARPRRLGMPKAIDHGPFNRELEAVARVYAGPLKGSMLAVSEENLDGAGNLKSWMWSRRKTISFSLKRHEDYLVTDMAIAPDGRSFVTLERSFNLPKLPGFAVRRFPLSGIKRGKVLKGEVLFSGRQPFFNVDNMEGLAVHTGPDGRMVLTMISDDNFNRRLQRTLIYRFVVKTKK